MVHADVSPGHLARLSRLLPVHSLGLREVFSLQRAELRTVILLDTALPYPYVDELC